MSPRDGGARRPPSRIPSRSPASWFGWRPRRGREAPSDASLGKEKARHDPTEEGRARPRAGSGPAPGRGISIAEYRSKTIEKTAQFLELKGSAANQFATTASAAVATIRESFRRGRDPGGDVAARSPTTWTTDGAYFPGSAVPGATSAGNERFHSDMNDAVARLKSLLTKEPRHQLFAAECKKWLLKLAFGPHEAKEATEAKRVGVDGAGKPH